jgi:hypothetical protein
MPLHAMDKQFHNANAQIALSEQWNRCQLSSVWVISFLNVYMTLQYSIIYYKICQSGLFLKQKWHFMPWQNTSRMPLHTLFLQNNGKDINDQQLDYNFTLLSQILSIFQLGLFLLQKMAFHVMAKHFHDATTHIAPSDQW